MLTTAKTSMSTDSQITWNILTASDLADKTSDAYSFDYYGETEWLKIVQFLLGQGLSKEAVEEIVRSKHTRQAADSSRGIIADAIDFIDHYKKHEKCCFRAFCNGEA